jgi:predicted NUDIX family NTP pyrophosphohydrolase
MPTQSAGIALYRRTPTGLEVLLVHMGGPFWQKKDKGAWTFPKGEFADDEDPLAAARRELKEETGCAASGDAISLGSVTQKSGKVVHLWASEGDCDATTITSNTFRVEWPRGSGRMHEFPEVDRAGWFSLDEAKEKLIAAQAEFVDRLRQLLSLIPSVPSGRRSR